MLQNAIGGLQGIIDQAMVGHYVGFAANAAIGVSWQIFLVVIVFISSLFTGMSVLIARFAGARDTERVNRTVYQAFLTAVALSLAVLAPLGYALAPVLLGLVNAAPEVRAQALPYLRILFVYSSGMLIFFMLGGALRSAGDARTPLRLGAAVTVLNIVLNFVLIRGLGPIPAFGTAGAAMGTVIAMGAVGVYALVASSRGMWVVRFPRGRQPAARLGDHRALFRFGLPAGVQGGRDERRGCSAARIHRLAGPQRGGAGRVCRGVHRALFARHLDGGRPDGRSGDGRRPEPRRRESGPRRSGRSCCGPHCACGRRDLGVLFLFAPRMLLIVFGMTDPVVVTLGVQLLRYLSVSGLFIAVALTYTGGPPGHRGHAQPALHLARVAGRFRSASAGWCSRRARSSRRTSGAPSCWGTSRAAC